MRLTTGSIATATAVTLSMAAVLTMAAPASAQMSMAHSRYGGPVYNGAPALSVTASLVKAGGGAAHWTAPVALTSMVGGKLVGAEVAKLTKQYGKAKLGVWLQIFDFAIADALDVATKAGVKLPAGHLSGKQLAVAMVTAGLDKDGTFYTENMLDHAVSHKVHEKTMEDIDAKFGPISDAEYHRITNQAMYDLAQALGARKVKLAKFH